MAANTMTNMVARELADFACAGALNNFYAATFRGPAGGAARDIACHTIGGRFVKVVCGFVLGIQLPQAIHGLVVIVRLGRPGQAVRLSVPFGCGTSGGGALLVTSRLGSGSGSAGPLCSFIFSR